MDLVYIMDPVYVSYVKYGLIGKTITKPPYQTTCSFFFLSGFSFTNIHESQDCRGRGRAFLNSSLPLPPASQTLRH